MTRYVRMSRPRHPVAAAALPGLALMLRASIVSRFGVEATDERKRSAHRLSTELPSHLRLSQVRELFLYSLLVSRMQSAWLPRPHLWCQTDREQRVERGLYKPGSQGGQAVM